jgi:hypothetical protein
MAPAHRCKQLSPSCREPSGAQHWVQDSPSFSFVPAVNLAFMSISFSVGGSACTDVRVAQLADSVILPCFRLLVEAAAADGAVDASLAQSITAQCTVLIGLMRLHLLLVGSSLTSFQ